MNGIVLVGGGGHCRAVIDVLEACALPVAGIVHGPDCHCDAVLGYPALGRDADLARLRATFAQALVTLGQMKSAAIRQKLFATLDAAGFELPVAVSPLARMSAHAQAGRGTVIMHQALVNACARVGENCIINTKALVEHDCVVESHCHIAVGAILCGGVHVGEGSLIGAGAVVKQGVRIGKNTSIGMGCVVRHDVPEGSVYAGSRA